MEQGTKKCPYCGEEIMAVAQKCKHCGEWLEHQQVAQASSNNENNDSFDDEDAKGCMHSILSWIVIALLIWAYNDKPSEEEMHQAILEDVRECVAGKTSSAIGLINDDEDNLLGELASMFISESGAAMETISQSFYECNEIRINEHWFYNTGEIVNADHPTGTIVALGICGFTIPFVLWDDFKLIH